MVVGANIFVALLNVLFICLYEKKQNSPVFKNSMQILVGALISCLSIYVFLHINFFGFFQIKWQHHFIFALLFLKKYIFNRAHFLLRYGISEFLN